MLLINVVAGMYVMVNPESNTPIAGDVGVVLGPSNEPSLSERWVKVKLARDGSTWHVNVGALIRPESHGARNSDGTALVRPPNNHEYSWGVEDPEVRAWRQSLLQQD